MNKYTSRNFLIILISPSGGGKSTIGDIVCEQVDNIDYSVSFTTRTPRRNEKDQIDYFFVTETEFENLIARNEFLEYAKVHGNYYGTSRNYIEDKLSSGRHVLLDIDIQGAKLVKRSGIDSITIFILPPSEAVLKKRLIERGLDSLETIEHRLENSVEEIEEIRNFEYLVINDELEEAANCVKSIIKAEESRIARFDKIKEVFYGEENVK